MAQIFSATQKPYRTISTRRQHQFPSTIVRERATVCAPAPGYCCAAPAAPKVASAVRGPAQGAIASPAAAPGATLAARSRPKGRRSRRRHGGNPRRPRRGRAVRPPPSPAWPGPAPVAAPSSPVGPRGASGVRSLCERLSPQRSSLVVVFSTASFSGRAAPLVAAGPGQKSNSNTAQTPQELRPAGHSQGHLKRLGSHVPKVGTASRASWGPSPLRFPKWPGSRTARPPRLATELMGPRRRR